MAQKWSEWDFKSHANFTVWVFILPKLNQKPEEFIYKKTLTSMTQIVSSNKLKWLTFHQSDFDVCAPVVDFLIRCYSFTECDTSPDQTWKAELCSSHALLHLWAAELRESYLTWPWLFFIPAVKLWPWACGYTRVKTTFITPETAVIPRALSSFLLIPPPPPSSALFVGLPYFLLSCPCTFKTPLPVIFLIWMEKQNSLQNFNFIYGKKSQDKGRISYSSILCHRESY